jgi:ABC-type sugar transport system ATPase subunit
MMIGRSLDAYFPGHSAPQSAPELLRVESLASPGKFQPLSFSIRSGEIVGMAGLVGSGRTEVTEALFGLDPQCTGRVVVDGHIAEIRSPRDAMRHGLGLVPEDRKRHGLVLSMSAGANISLAVLERLSRLGWLDRRAEASEAGSYFARLRIRAPSLATLASTLSGGNQQKLVMAKWLAARCRILLVDEPTRGVDVGAKAEIHALLSDLARAGSAILLVSSELPEVLNLSDRTLVMRAGRLVGEVARADATQEAVLRLMAGVE